MTGYDSKRQMAADKVQEPVANSFEEYCKTLPSLWNTHISRTYAEQFFRAGQAAQPSQEPVVQPAPGYCKNCKDYTVEKPLHTQPAQEPVAKAWNDGYKAGVADERTSEANIGIAGFGAKIKPARQNPYGVAQPAQEPVACIRSLTDQCAALIWERDELQKQVWRYEKNGVTCQIYGHKVDSSCSECNVHENYTAAPKREWVGLTDEDIYDCFSNDPKVAMRNVEQVLQEKN